MLHCTIHLDVTICWRCCYIQIVVTSKWVVQWCTERLNVFCVLDRCYNHYTTKTSYRIDQAHLTYVTFNLKIWLETYPLALFFRAHWGPEIWTRQNRSGYFLCMASRNTAKSDKVQPTCILYTLHYNPQFVYFLAHFSFYNQDQLILQTIYVPNKDMSAKNPRFIIRSGFKSRAGYNGACTVYIGDVFHFTVFWCILEQISIWGRVLPCFFFINRKVFVQRFSKFSSLISDPPKTIVAWYNFNINLF